MFNIFAVSTFVIVPFFYEITYPISYIVSWWDIIDFNFFYRLTIIFWISSTINLLMQTSIRWISWKFIFILSSLITISLFHLFFSHALNYLFAYFTDIKWFKKTGWLDFNSASHGLAKWGWGGDARDNFSYHKTTTVFWYKNDSPFASALFLFNFFILLSVFFIFLQWLMILRSLFSIKDINYTLLTYGVSSIFQFYIYYMYIAFFVITSIFYQLSRIALDSTWEVFLYEIFSLIVNFVHNNFII